MAKTCLAQKTTVNHRNSTYLDARRKEKEKETEADNNMEKNS